MYPSELIRSRRLSWSGLWCQNTVLLGTTETAEYAGSTSGSKDLNTVSHPGLVPNVRLQEELLAGITNPQNWLRNAAVRASSECRNISGRRSGPDAGVVQSRA